MKLQVGVEDVVCHVFIERVLLFFLLLKPHRCIPAAFAEGPG